MKWNKACNIMCSAPAYLSSNRKPIWNWTKCWLPGPYISSTILYEPYSMLWAAATNFSILFRSCFPSVSTPLLTSTPATWLFRLPNALTISNTLSGAQPSSKHDPQLPILLQLFQDLLSSYFLACSTGSRVQQWYQMMPVSAQLWIARIERVNDRAGNKRRPFDRLGTVELNKIQIQ